MRRHRLRPGDDGLTPVVGAVLLVGIAVLLMSVVGAFVLGFGPGEQPPEAEVQFEQIDNGTDTYDVNITVVDVGGLREEEVDVTVSGESPCYASSNDWTGSGSIARAETVSVYGQQGSCSAGIGANTTVSVIWDPQGSDQSGIVGEYTTV